MNGGSVRCQWESGSGQDSPLSGHHVQADTGAEEVGGSRRGARGARVSRSASDTRKLVAKSCGVGRGQFSHRVPDDPGAVAVAGAGGAGRLGVDERGCGGPVHGDQIPLVYLKYRPIANRFANRNSHVELAEPDQLFSQVELDQLLLMAKKMGIAFGEFDVLRDQDQRLYVVDVNNTPAGPPNGLPDAQARQALALMQKSFDALLLSFEATPATDS